MTTPDDPEAGPPAWQVTGIVNRRKPFASRSEFEASL